RANKYRNPVLIRRCRDVPNNRGGGCAVAVGGAPCAPRSRDRTPSGPEPGRRTVRTARPLSAPRTGCELGGARCRGTRRTARSDDPPTDTHRTSGTTRGRGGRAAGVDPPPCASRAALHGLLHDPPHVLRH